jgi:2-methylisocitrate lyase-like PEP mutase family enzyme
MTAPEQTLRKGVAFRDLHAAGTFVMPNPWDANVLAGLGHSVREHGTFSCATLPYADANALMETDGSR